MPEKASWPRSLPAPIDPAPLNATGAAKGQAIACASSAKPSMPSFAAGDVVASCQSRRPARTESEATVARQGGAVATAAGALAAATDAPLPRRHADPVRHGLPPAPGRWRPTSAAAGRRRRRARNRRCGGEHQVDLAGSAAHADQVRRVDLDAAQGDALLERPQRVDGDLDAADAQQLLRPGIHHLEAGRAHRAADVQRQLRPLLEGDAQVDGERRGAELHRQAARQVAEEGNDVEAFDADAQLAIAALRERRRRARGVEAAAVEGEREPRLDLHLALGWQRADEGHAELDRAQPVVRLQRLVDEVGAAVADDDVVHGEAGRLVTALGGGEPLQHVVDVVAAIADAAQVQHRCIDLEAVDHRGEAQDRLRGEVDEDAPDREQRRCGRRRAFDDHVGERQLELPRIDHGGGLHPDEGGGRSAHAVLHQLSPAILLPHDGRDGRGEAAGRHRDGDAGRQRDDGSELIVPIAMEEKLRFAIREGGRTVGAGVVAPIIE